MVKRLGCERLQEMSSLVLLTSEARPAVVVPAAT
jgi:hypothetical protein